MKVGLDLIDEQYDSIRRSLLPQCRGLEMLDPCPDNQVGEADDSFHPGRPVWVGNGAIRHPQGGKFPAVVEVELLRLSTAQRLQRMRERPNHILEILER